MTDFTDGHAITALSSQTHPSGKLMTQSQVEVKKQSKHKPQTRTEAGVNEGGGCMMCGAALKFWFNYKLCDRCIVIPEGAVIQT